MLFLRRRRREALLAAGCFLALSFTAHAFPRRWAAELVVTPRGVAPYEAPVERLVAGAVGPESLERAATVAGVTTAASVLELFESDAGLEERLGVRAEVRRTASGALEGVVLHAEAPARYQADQLVQALARELIERNAALERELRGQAPAPSALTAGPTGSGSQAERNLRETRQRLATLRERNPRLRAANPAGELLAVERALGEERVELTGWEARVAAAASAAAELEQAVRREAELAWQAERRAQPVAPVGAAPASSEQGPTREPTRLERLEAELVRLLATRTDRHPDVRRVVREIEAEREAERQRGQLGVPEPARQQPVSVPPRDEGSRPWDRPVVDRPLVDQTVLVAGEGGAGGEGPPPAFFQRAPSYGPWVAARTEEAQARREVEVRRKALEARQAEHARLESEEATLSRVRAEEAGLSRQVEELEQAARVGAARVEPGPLAAPIVPLQVAAPARLTPLTWAPWSTGQGLALALLLALTAGWVVDMFDRSYHQAEELGDLPVPVLGVVPHLRGR